MKKTFFTGAFVALSLLVTPLFAVSPFNNKLTDKDKAVLDSGEILIKKINFSYNMSLAKDYSEQNDKLLSDIKKFNPKYLAEVIQVKPVEGNEDLPERLEELLLAIPDYAGIPYYSVRNDEWNDLYSAAWIDSIEETEDGKKKLSVHFEMAPFGIVDEDICIEKTSDFVSYDAINTNLLRYFDNFDCVQPRKMRIVINLFKDGDNWILYGIGGVNAPRIPFFTERIDTSFINRIKTFCFAIFNKL